MKIYKTIPCFFLMATLCGCTTQSIEDAKAIERQNHMHTDMSMKLIQQGRQ